jgi:hypothetical protein
VIAHAEIPSVHGHVPSVALFGIRRALRCS